MTTGTERAQGKMRKLSLKRGERGHWQSHKGHERQTEREKEYFKEAESEEREHSGQRWGKTESRHD